MNSHRIFQRGVARPDGCLEWTGAQNGNGYGHVQVDKKMWLVHRLAYSLCVGDIPEGMLVLHRCDNRRCFNPGHLFLGTAADNTMDMMRKGRDYWSQRTHCAQGHSFAEHGRIATRKTGKKYRCCLACKADEQRRRRSQALV